MTFDKKKLEKRLAFRLNKFSGKFMSNAKWTKLFETLSKNDKTIKKCLGKSIWDDYLREIHIPPIDEFSETFHDTGFKDSGGNQPSNFKEIEWIEFPSKWTISRQMRGQTLEPYRYEQDIIKIKNEIDCIGQLETELDNEKLIVYGYK
jgi:hypothetical protein